MYLLYLLGYVVRESVVSVCVLFVDFFTLYIRNLDTVSFVAIRRFLIELFTKK